MTENLGEIIVQLYLSSIPNIISGLKTIIIPNVPYIFIAVFILVALRHLYQTYRNREK